MSTHTLLEGTEYADWLDGGEGDDLLLGFAGHDNLWSYDGHDTLEGGSGDDTLRGDNGNDVLYGGTGDDVIEGGRASDSYYLSAGFGADSIADYDTSALGDDHDRIIFEGLQTSDLQQYYRSSNDDLVLRFSASDVLTVQGYFLSYSGRAIAPERQRIEAFEFSDRTIYHSSIVAGLRTLGGPGGDLLMPLQDNGSAISSRMYGEGSHDTLFGSNQADTLSGGQGDDSLIGGDADDLLIDGAGNDTLLGGMGADIYRLSGSGHDLVNDYDYDLQVTAIDRLELKSVAVSDVHALERHDEDLLLIYGNNNSLTVRHHFRPGAYAPDYKDASRIELFVLKNYVADEDDVIRRVRTIGSSGDDRLTPVSDNGVAQASRLYGMQGHDSLLGSAYKDQLHGGEGDDSLHGGAGNDSLVGGDGSDLYVVAYGSGRDSVNEQDSDPAGNADSDRIVFTDVAASDLSSISRSGDDLLLAWGTSDSVLIRNYFNGDAPASSSAGHIEQLAFADNVVADEAQVQAWLASSASALVSSMSSASAAASAATSTGTCPHDPTLSSILAAPLSW